MVLTSKSSLKTLGKMGGAGAKNLAIVSVFSLELL